MFITTFVYQIVKLSMAGLEDFSNYHDFSVDSAMNLAAWEMVKPFSAVDSDFPNTRKLVDDGRCVMCKS